MLSSFQLFLILKCLMLGFVYGFIYFLITFIKKRLNVILIIVIDLALFLIFGVGQFLVFLTQNNGKIAFFGLVFTILGFIAIFKVARYLSYKTLIIIKKKIARKSDNS